MADVRAFLRSTGLPAGDLNDLPDSAKRFPDGARYRIEIPSTEGPACLEAVLEEVERLDVLVHRVSQGSGVFMQTDAELDAMAQTAAGARLEVSLFARPNAAWGLSASARVNGAFAATAHGQEQVVANLEDCFRAAAHGFRSVLIADLGVLAVFGEARAVGLLPPEMQAKVSVMLPAANPAAARVLERLGASRSTYRPTSRCAQIAAVRAAVDMPLDVYVEAPDNLRRFRPPPRDPGIDPHRRARLRQVRAAQRARSLPRGLAPRVDCGRAQPRTRTPRAPRARAAGAIRLSATGIRARRYRPRASHPTYEQGG